MSSSGASRGGGGVTTFNTRTGAVTLAKADVTGTGLGAGDVGADAAGLAAGEQTRAQAAEALAAQKSANLGDLASAASARTNLGLGSAATQASSAFDAAGLAAGEQTRAQAAEALLAPLASLAANVISGGSLASSSSLALSPSRPQWLVGTLVRNVTLTLTGRAAGAQALLLLTQDDSGGHTLTISDGVNSSAVAIASTPDAFTAVLIDCPDATDVCISTLSQPGPSGPTGPAGATGATGPTGPAGTTGPTGPFVIARSGYWYANAIPSAIGNKALTLNVQYFVPIFLPVAVTVDQMGVKVAVAAATAVLRLGIYANDATKGIPAALLAALPSTLDASVTGTPSGSFSSALALAPGEYWLSIVNQGAACSIFGGGGNVGAPGVGCVTLTNTLSGFNGSYGLSAITGAMASIAATAPSDFSVLPQIAYHIQ